MRHLYSILILLFLLTSYLQTTPLFNENATVNSNQIIEHLQNKNIKTTPNIKEFFKAGNEKFEIPFSENDFKNKKKLVYLDKIDIKIQKYYFYFVILKSILVLIIILLTLYNLKKSSSEENFSEKEFILISTLAIYQPLHFYITNLQEIPLWLGMLIIFCVYAYFFLNYKLLYILTNNKNKSLISGIILTFLCLNFLYAPEILFVLSSFAIMLASKTDFKKNKNLIITITTVILLCELVLLIFNTSKIIAGKISVYKDLHEQTIVNNTKDRDRSIYIIILDSYSGQNIIKQKWGDDNSEFINKLKDEGFFVFNHMYSNYNYTYATLPAILNLEFLENTNFKSSSQAIGNSLLFKIAKTHGYNTIFKKSSLFNIKSKYIDITSEDSSQNYYSIFSMFLKNNFFKGVIIKYLPQRRISMFYEDILPGNNFVFIHVMAPHFPYLYDENETPIPYSESNDMDKSYLKYLKYVNKKTYEYIKFLKENYEKKPVIIITGDHGLREENNIESLYSTFTAYYTPEENYEHVKNCKTLINFFINFSNYEFNTNVKNKPDKKLEIYKTEPIQEYSIIKEVKVAKDVTSKLKY